MTSDVESAMSRDEALRELAQLEAALGRRSLLGFTRYTMPTFIENWHHQRIAMALDAVLRGEIKRLMIFMPPQNGKSELVSRRFPAYALGRQPNLQLISCSYNADLAKEMSQDVQKVIESPAYRTLFPKTRLATARDVGDVRMSARFDVPGYEGAYRAAGVGQGITGKPMSLGIIDDPVKNRAEAESETFRRMVWNWYVADFTGRHTTDQTAVVLVQTRWHEDDLAGRLLRLAAENPQADQWHVVSFPAVSESVRDDDPRQPGEALWPSRFSRDWLEARRVGIGVYDWCTPAETPILMGDFTTKRIDEIVLGDVVMGFVKRDGEGGRRKLVATKVLATGRRRAPVRDLLMESGRRARCTKEHRWFNGRWGRKNKYVPARVGLDLHFAAEPYDDCTDRELLLWNIVCDVGAVYRKLIRFTEAAKKPSMLVSLTSHGAGRNERGRDKVVAITEGRIDEDVFSLQTETGNYVAWGYLSSNSALYQQRPVPAGGAMAQRVWFPVGLPMSYVLRRCRAWDLAGSIAVAGSEPAWTVGTLLAQCLDPTTSRSVWVVEHVVRVRLTANAVDALMLQTARADGRSVLIREWQDPGQAGKAVIASHRRLLAGFDYDSVLASGEKTLQWRPFLVQAEGGDVRLVTGAWNREWLDEMSLIPYGRFFDQADSVALAFNVLSEHKVRGPAVGAIMPANAAGLPSDSQWRRRWT